MAKKRLIPKLQLMPSRLSSGRLSLVTTVGFDRIIEVGDPVSQAKIYEAQAVDELIFIDLSPAKGEGSGQLPLRLLQDVAREVFLPLTIGGGVRSVDDFRLLLQHGADKVAVNSAALAQPALISEASRRFGAQCVVVSIDYRCDADGQWRVYSRSGQQPHPLHPVDWARQAEALGAGELLLTGIDQDGSRNGLELDIARQVCAAVRIPVILSGGCGRAAHFVEGFREAGADAVAAGTFFCFQDQNPMQTRGHVKNAGFEIRIHT